MSSSFIMDNAEYPPFSRRDLYIIFAAGIASLSIGLLITSPLRPTLNPAPLLNSVDIVSMTFVTGLFSFLTAGILFSSHASRQYFLGRIDNNREKRAYQTRVLHVILITGLFAVVTTLVAFILPIVLGTASQYTIGFSHLEYLLPVLGASLVISTFLAILASSLAVITDDSRLCVALGCASTIIIANVAGWTANIGTYSLNRNIAFLSPHNLFRGLAVQLSGYQFESPNQMVTYLGFIVTIEGLAVAILILSLISIVILVTGHRALSRNSTRWTVLEGMIPREQVWSSMTSPEEVQEVTRIRKGLKIQRVLSVVIVGLLLVSVNVGGSMNTANYATIPTIVHYESPESGEKLQTGVWMMIDLDVQPPYPGLFNSLHFYYSVIDWGNTTGFLTFYYEILDMNSTEFGALSESSRLELVYDSQVEADGRFGRGIGHNIEEAYGAYVCVLKIVPVADPLENSYLNATLLVEQESI